jgi:PDGLE domain
MRLSTKLFVVLGLAIAVGLATAVSPYASASPDGLTKVAGDKGFLEQGTLASVQDSSPIPGYAFPGIDDERVAKGIAGFVGTFGVFAVAFGLAWLLRRRSDPLEGGAAAHGRAV